MTALIESYADMSIKLSNLKFDKIGSLDTDQDGNIIVGQDTYFAFHGHPEGHTFGGPYLTLLDRYLFCIDNVLSLIRNQVIYRHRLLFAYLLYLDLRKLVRRFAILYKQETEFYIEHPDSHAGNIMFKGTQVSGYLDWEW